LNLDPVIPQLPVHAAVEIFVGIDDDNWGRCRGGGGIFGLPFPAIAARTLFEMPLLLRSMRASADKS
jgi:hypothetical protein